MTLEPRWPCIVGVGQRTWHRDEVGESGAPEPLAMWEEVARSAADDAAIGARLLEDLDALEIVYCQTWQYDDPVARLAARLGCDPRRRYYSGIGGTTPQVLVQDAAQRILSGEADRVLVVGAEALATQAAVRKAGETYRASFKPSEKRPYPWEAPFHPVEVAHDVLHAWLTFAIFDNARRAHLGIGLPEYRRQLAEMMAPMTEIAAGNPRSWFPVRRTVDDLLTPRPDNRMVGYPYTKYMVAVMDVDMAGALVITSHAEADRLGVPDDRRVYLRGWCYGTDPTYVAEHASMWRSPAMAAVSDEVLRVAGIGIDDVAHLDLYSCFGSSLHFARDALGLGADDPRPLTVTGGLPYHGGPASNYMTHSITTMVDVLRADPGSYGLVSGVGMHMTKHVFGLYSTDPGPVRPPEQASVQSGLDAQPVPAIRAEHAGEATVAAYSVAHGRDGAPEWGVAVCDLADGARTYARLDDPDLLVSAEEEELVGRRLRLVPEPVELAIGGEATRNVARLV
ncbi:MAG: acetyl-CoA acetyltransferase [Acidimicrobiia bacterium]